MLKVVTDVYPEDKQKPHKEAFKTLPIPSIVKASLQVGFSPNQCC